MEDGSWSGAAGEVTDSSGNGLNGRAVNGASIADADPALAPVPGTGTCAYGTFYGSEQYLEVADNDQLDIQDELTVTAWIHPLSIPGGGLMTILSKDENFEFHVNSANEINWWWGGPDLTTTGANISAGQWYHIAITYESGQQRIYVDGTRLASGSRTGRLPTNSDPLQIGADQNFAGRYFDGRIDEVRVYDAALSASEVRDVRDLTRPCTETEGLVAEYRMDEASWSGTTGEVTESSGNNLDGTARTAGSDGSYPDTVPAQVCNGGRFRGQGYNISDPPYYIEAQHYVQVPDADALSPLADTGSMTVSGWFRPNTNNDGTLVHKGAGNRTQEYRVYFENDRLKASVWDEDGSPLTVTATPTLSSGNWYFFALTADNPNGNTMDLELTVYSASTLLGQGSNDRGNFMRQYGNKPLTADLLFGAVSYGGTPTDYLDGTLDEVRLHDRVLSDSEVTNLRDITRPCGGGIDHFVLRYASNAINCRAEGITLRAKDASGDLVTDYDGSVNLSTSENIGDWTEVVDGNGSLNAGADNSGDATYTFDASDGGDAVLALRVTEADTLTVNAAAANDPATDDGTQGAITFRPWGFEIDGDPDASGRNPVPTQVAGREFDIEIAAVGELPEDPGCNVIEEYAGDRNLAFWFDYENPATGDLQVLIENTQIASSEGDASEQTINFTGGVARVSVNYRDVGEIQLHASDDDGIGAPPDAGGDEIVGGGTGPFVVRPYAFEVDVPNDPDSDPSILGPNQSAFRTAGEAFDVTVRALVWGDDDDDGTPDTGDELHDNDATPNFGQEGESVQITPALVAPTPGSNGSLSNATFDTFTDGTQTKNTLRWNEVGYVDLQANLVGNDYLGTGEDVTGVAETIGRFYPDRFRLSGTSLTDRATPGLACTGTSAFTYIGERFDTGFTLTAVATDAVGSNTTTNYEGAYAHLDSQGVLNLGAIDQDDAERTGSVQIDNASIGWADGQSDVALQLRYVRDDPEGPYDPLRVGVAPEDPVDGVTLDPADVNLDVDGNNAHGQTGAVQLRFGRLLVENAGGSELANINLPLRVEYWTGSTWSINTLDDCTTLTLTDHVDLVNNDGDTATGNEAILVDDGPTEILGGDLMIMGGRAEATFDAPEAGNTGWVELTVDLDGAAPTYDYLATDPDGDDAYIDDPVGRVTFGIYSGDDEWVHMRRVR